MGPESTSYMRKPPPVRPGRSELKLRRRRFEVENALRRRPMTGARSGPRGAIRLPQGRRPERCGGWGSRHLSHFGALRSATMPANDLRRKQPVHARGCVCPRLCRHMSCTRAIFACARVLNRSPGRRNGLPLAAGLFSMPSPRSCANETIRLKRLFFLWRGTNKLI